MTWTGNPRPMSTDGMPFARIEQHTSPQLSRYWLRDSRQRVAVSGLLLFLFCCVPTADALAYYVGTSQGQQQEAPAEITLSKDDRMTIVMFCRAAQHQEKIRAKLKDPEAFMRICDQLISEFRRLRGSVRERRRVF